LSLRIVRIMFLPCTGPVTINILMPFPRETTKGYNLAFEVAWQRRIVSDR
jgi:hypothetical protein